MSQPGDDVFAARPTSVFLEGIGEVPVVYSESAGDDVFAEPLPEVDPAAVLCAAAPVEWARVGDDMVLWNPSHRTSQVLDPMAGLLWQCMDGTGTVGEILADMAEVFAVPVAQVRSDFGPAVAGWVRDGFLVDPSADSPPASTPAHPWSFLVDPPND